MSKIRVLVVDDSVVVRKLVTEILSTDPSIEVVGSAANGRIALAKIPQVNPDLVTLDVEMPELDGLETLKELRKTWTRLPVIMLSALTEKAASTTLQALSLGASDYITKPQGAGSMAAAMEHVGQQLLPKVRALCNLPAPEAPKPDREALGARPLVRAPVGPPTATPLTGAIDVIAIGCSTGGPNALGAIFPRLPANLPVPVVITQHMPPLFTKLLADRLTASSSLIVHEAAAGQTLEAGHAYIAPGDHHLVFRRDGTRVVTALHQGPPENSCRPAVDVMFRSVAQTWGGRVLAIVLTGMGQDGLRGVELLHPLGAQIVVQDEASSVVWGMPGFIARAGLAHATVPIDRVVDEIVTRVGRRAARELGGKPEVALGH